jgi:hypothetical protein
MATVYFLYSPSIDKFYTGSCKELAERFSRTFPNIPERLGKTRLELLVDHLIFQAVRIRIYRIERYPELEKN